MHVYMYTHAHTHTHGHTRIWATLIVTLALKICKEYTFNQQPYGTLFQAPRPHIHWFIKQNSKQGFIVLKTCRSIVDF